VGASPTWVGALFKSYALLSAAPGADSVNEETTTSTVSSNLLFLLGIFTFATILGIITSSIEEHVQWVLEANHRVVERGHTVLLNWSERTLPILRQIAESRATGFKALPVVILANRDVGEMREAVRQGLGALRLPVTVRSGHPTSIQDLDKVSVGHASRILITCPEGMAPDDVKVQCVCASVLQEQCQPARAHGMDAADLHTVVVQSRPSKLPDRLGYTSVQRLHMAQRVVSATVVQHGLTEVYYDIFTEVRFAPVRKFKLARLCPCSTLSARGGGLELAREGGWALRRPPWLRDRNALNGPILSCLSTGRGLMGQHEPSARLLSPLHRRWASLSLSFPFPPSRPSLRAACHRAWGRRRR
jgi:hypothetical protein